MHQDMHLSKIWAYDAPYFAQIKIMVETIKKYALWIFGAFFLSIWVLSTKWTPKNVLNYLLTGEKLLFWYSSDTVERKKSEWAGSGRDKGSRPVSQGRVVVCCY